MYDDRPERMSLLGVPGRSRRGDVPFVRALISPKFLGGSEYAELEKAMSVDRYPGCAEHDMEHASE